MNPLIDPLRLHRPRNIVRAAALLAALGLTPAVAVADMQPQGLEKITSLWPAVVAIQTFAITPQGRWYFEGSGFIIEPSGIIVTNRHVLAGAYQIRVTVPSFPTLEATPLYISGEIDLALLKVDAGQKLPTVQLGDSDSVHIGDHVMLVGNPLGVGQSVSFGVASALNRDIGETIYDHFIQTDAALNHGNSGGAMFNMAGEVIGINTGLTSSPGNTGSIGIGYAMPINDAKFVIDQYLHDGKVIYGTVGVHAQRITDDLAAAFGMERPRGAIVTGVAEHGPAAGNIRAGDIILSVGTQDASDTRAVARLIASSPPGRLLDIGLLRGGVELRVSVPVAMAESDPKKAMAVLGHPPEEAKVFATPSAPGIGMSAIDDEVRKNLRLDADQNGVVVTSVDPKGVAAGHGIAVADVILAVGGDPVSTPIDVQQDLRAAVDHHRPFAALLVAGKKSTRWVALPLEADR